MTRPQTWVQLCDAMAQAERVGFIRTWRWCGKWISVRACMLVVADRFVAAISQKKLSAARIPKHSPVYWSDDRVVVSWSTDKRHGSLSLIALDTLPADARKP